MINTLLFDCFGVICDPVLYGWYRDHRLNKGYVDANLKNVFEKLDLGESSEEDILDYFSKYEGITLSKEALRTQIDSYLKIDNDLAEVIRELKGKGFKTALLSNAEAAFFKRKVFPTYPDFKNLFDEIVISSEVGMIKPNRDIYEYTLRKIGSKAEESLFIDDSKVNVDAAIALGIKGFLYTECSSFKKYIATQLS